MSSFLTTRNRQISTPLQALILGSAVALVCAVSIAVTRDIAHIATIWLSNGFVIGILLRSQMAKWPAFAIAAFLANLGVGLFAGDGLLLSVGFAACNTFEIAVAAIALRRHIDPEPVPHKLAAAQGYIAAWVLAAPIVPSIMGAWLATADHTNSFWNSLELWYPADVLGIVIVTPFVLLMSSNRLAPLFSNRRRRNPMFSLCLLAVTSVGVFAQSDYPFLFVTFPPLLLVVFDLEIAGVALGLFTLTTIALALTLCGYGPFTLAHTTNSAVRILLVQFYMGVAAMTAYPVGNVLAARRTLQRTLREGERRYRTLSENTTDIIVRASIDGIRNYISPSVVDVLGWHPAELLGKARMDLLHPDDRVRFEREEHAMLAGTRSSILAYRYRHKEGHYVWMESASRFTYRTGPNGEDEIVRVIRDISARKAMEEALAKGEADWRAVTDNVPALISFIDADGVVRFANATFEEWLGLRSEQVIGSHLSTVLGSESYAEQKEGLARALSGESLDLDLVLKCGKRRRRTRVSYVPRWSAAGVIIGAFSIATDLTAVKEAEDRLSQLARFDTLTGLPNRHQFNERLEELITAGSHGNQSIGLLFFDIDQFKQINDTYGHGVGDKVLCEVGFRLMCAVRDVDLAARLAGDEFVAIIVGPNSPTDFEEIAQRILRRMQMPVHVGEQELNITTSIGGAFASTCGVTGSDLLHCADSALYQVKRAGRNAFQFAHCRERRPENAAAVAPPRAQLALN